MDPTAEVEGMRRAAARLRQRAADLAAIDARLDHQIGSMVYAGPAADRFRADIRSKRNEIGTAAGHLLTLADTLTRNAATTEADIRRAGGLPS